MKVLDLQCQHHHRFEGWFASEDDFAHQLVKGLLECPVCADKAIVKMLSAPRLNLGAAPAVSSPAAVAHAPGQPDQPQVTPSETADVQAAFLKAVRHVLANTENVGEHFAQEARKMHYGEAEARNIRGQATPAETQALLEEGIPVLPLPVPKHFNETLQ